MLTNTAPDTAVVDKTGNRILTIDILRGVAILSIFIVHFTGDYPGLWMMKPEQVAALPYATVNGWVDQVINFLITDKARTIFSLMFGVSFYLQLSSAEKRNQAFVPLFLRRLGVLLAIGLLHAHLLYGGDILRYYVIGGLFLLLAHRWSSRWLIIVGVLLTVVLPLAGGMLFELLKIDAGRPDVALYLKGKLAPTYGEFLWANHQSALWRYKPGMLLNYGVPAMGNFLFGIWIARKGYLQRPHEHRRPLKRLFGWGLAIGLLGQTLILVLGMLIERKVIGFSPVLFLTAGPFIYLGYEALAIGYIAGIALLCRSDRWQQRLSILAPAGRMTLTNYVGQSVIGVFVFAHFALGLTGKVGSAQCLVMVLILGVLQLLANRWWLQHFRMGPLEWVWRSLAAGRWQSIKLSRLTA